MHTKLLLILTIVFYLADQRAADEVWRFCMIASAILTVCAFFFGLENGRKRVRIRKR